MEYALAVWLMWASGEVTFVRITPLPSVKACVEIARSLSRELDNLDVFYWECDPVKKEETGDA
ncbi:MAG: hypothetical protein FVQ79_13430 [Planctomycetes bacterium]|nr:hypothetical protein [Planctomycetota bacterium]